MLEPMALPHCAKGTAQVLEDEVRVRTRKVDGKVVGFLAKGESVTIWAVEAGWAIIQTSSLTGWASMEYLHPDTDLLP
jgi:uncharacterized protein YgiM (DUF1202 family)